MELAGRALAAAAVAIARGTASLVRRLAPRARLATGFVLTGLILTCLAAFWRPMLLASLYHEAGLWDLVQKTGLNVWLARIAMWTAVVGLGQWLAAAVIYTKRRLALQILKSAAAAAGALWLYIFYVLAAIPWALHSASPETFVGEQRNAMIVFGVLLWIPPAILIASMLLMLGLRSTAKLYVLPADVPAEQTLAERILTNLRSHGRDRQFRTSTYYSVFIHVALLMLPFLLTFRGCSTDAYVMPYGSGDVVVRVVRVKKPKKKPVERMVLNMDSPFLHWRPEDTQVDQQLFDQTEAQYEANAQKKQGMGVGGGKGGWPSGAADGVIRFVRLKYKGGDWDQDMGFGADYNFLIQLHELTGLRIARNTEGIEISKLARFKKGQKPPFVFVTGMGHINVSTREVQILRQYLLKDGGMLFADNGGGHFDHSFRALMHRVLPGLYWVDIPNDDILYRQPFVFPHGAPKMWHHSGDRALGMRHGDRWVVFYHQGDLNDGWKTKHSGASAYLSQMAYKMGINVVHYAFNQYYHFNYGAEEQLTANSDRK